MISHLRQISVDFTELLTLTITVNASRSIRESVSRRYPFIPLFELPVVAPAYAKAPQFYHYMDISLQRFKPCRIVVVCERVARLNTLAQRS